MEQKKKRWTDEEVKYLSDQVKANPQNLSAAFRNVAEKTGRTVGAVNVKWYDYTKKGNHKTFVLVSPKKGIYNRKNITKTPSKEVKESKLKRIIRIIFNLEK